ncbi:hypothetical protein AB0B25_05320 [Nocardia sp. NPDC049190]|uniref:hypothetical protein n=1 Tax=Nocardia sp. NPDC049190 TaxID=3155650 RepID=UPI0033C92EB6
MSTTRGEPQTPNLDDVFAVVRILELPGVAFPRGEPGGIVLARILDMLEALASGEDYGPRPAGVDSR